MLHTIENNTFGDCRECTTSLRHRCPYTQTNAWPVRFFFAHASPLSSPPPPPNQPSMQKVRKYHRFWGGEGEGAYCCKWDATEQPIKNKTSMLPPLSLVLFQPILLEAKKKIEADKEKTPCLQRHFPLSSHTISSAILRIRIRRSRLRPRMLVFFFIFVTIKI